jgi:hypothetical protein
MLRRTIKSHFRDVAAQHDTTFNPQLLRSEFTTQITPSSAIGFRWPSLCLWSAFRCDYARWAT